MANEYTVRTNDGLMVAKLGYKLFNAILLDAEGHWGVDGQGDDRFFIDEDGVYTANNDVHALRLYLWAGYSISQDY